MAEALPIKTSLTPKEAATDVINRRLARSHLVNFCAYTHPEWETGQHHERIGTALEALERGDIERLMIHAPPRHSKSEMASRRFPAWYLGKHPGHQILLSSYGDEIAEDLSRNVRNILRDPYYQVLFPETKLATDTTAAGRWETTAGGIFVAVGIGGAATGRGANLGIIDDPVKNRMDADSARIREVAWQWYHGVFRTRLMRGGKLLIMCTRWHEDDLAGRLLQTEGSKWTVLNLPAIEDEGTPNEKALWERMYSLGTMTELRSDLRAAGRSREWNSQYQQNPTPEEGTYVKRQWFDTKYTDVPKPLNVYISSDYAVTEASQGRDPDYTVHGVFGLAPDGKMYVLDWWKSKTSPDVWIDALLDLVVRWKPLGCCAGKGIIRRAVEKMILTRCNERKIYYNQVWVDEIVDKAVKGRAFQARASMGNILWPNTEWANDALETIVGFPTLKHDDDFDVLANMCLFLDEARPPMQILESKVIEADRWKKAKSLAQTDRWKVL